MYEIFSYVCLHSFVQVRVAGVDVRDYSQASLRQNIGVVAQVSCDWSAGHNTRL